MLNSPSFARYLALWVFPFFLIFCLSASAEPVRFKIGAVLPLTGVAAEYGIAIKNCIELAKQDRPELFKNIDFIYEDAAFDPKQAATALNKLVSVDHVDLLYTWGVAFCKALAPIAESRKIPLVGQCIDPESAANRPRIIRFMNFTDQYMSLQARYLKAKGVNKIGILLAEHPYLEEMLAALKRNLLPGQTVEIVDQLPPSEMNLRAYISKFKKTQFDAIGVFLYAGQISEFYKQAAEQSFTALTFGTNFFESLSELKIGGGTMSGAVFVSNEIKDAFLKRYREIFQNESQLSFGAPAYEFALTVGDLFGDRSEPPSSDKILDLFAELPTRQGVAAGPYHYVNDSKVGRFFEFPLVVKRIEGNNLVALPEATVR